MYNWYGTREENARGNSLANNVSGLLTENYAFRSSERKGGGEEEGEFSISSNRYSSPLLSGREISNQWNDSKGEERFFCEGVPRGVFLSTRVRFSFAEKSARARQVGRERARCNHHYHQCCIVESFMQSALQYAIS